MNYNNPIPSSISNLIRLACAVMFALFSFFYLFCIQNDVLAEAQYVFSNGVTTYSRFFGAAIITVFLLLIQYLISRVARLSGCWYALTYFPSFLLLTILTSMSRSSIENFSFGKWIWIFPVLVILYILFLKFKNYMPGESIEDNDYSVSRYLWPNFLILFSLMVFCGANATVSDVYMYELKAERLILDEDYESASRVGEKSRETSKRLNELRMFALAKQGLLGERLFEYPQLYGENSLIIFDDTVTYLHRFTAKNIQEDLGAWANGSVNSVDYYLELLRKNRSTCNNPLLGDYLLCCKLLRKDLSGFNSLIKHYYNLNNPVNVMALPRAYREAMLLQARSISMDSLNSYADTLMLTEYKNYHQIQESDTAAIIKANILRRDFGKTLWWYIDKN